MYQLLDREINQIPKTKSVKVIVATIRALQTLAINPQISEEDLMSIIRKYTGNDEVLMTTVCFMVLETLQRIKDRRDNA